MGGKVHERVIAYCVDNLGKSYYDLLPNEISSLAETISKKLAEHKIVMEPGRWDDDYSLSFPTGRTLCGYDLSKCILHLLDKEDEIPVDVESLTPHGYKPCIRCNQPVPEGLSKGPCIQCMLDAVPWKEGDRVRIKSTGIVGIVEYRYYNGFTLVNTGEKIKGGIFNNNSTYENAELEKV